MSEQILVSSRSAASGKHAMLADNELTGWLYLHAPGPEPDRTGEVEGAGFVYCRDEPIEMQDVSKYRPDPPPIAKPYASPHATCREPESFRWEIGWSRDGQAVVLIRDGEPWCMMAQAHPRGLSKAVGTTGPWGSPWSEDFYKQTAWERLE
jgi:hypothetical protein